MSLQLPALIWSRPCTVKTPASGPHGLAFDKEGNLWFTANSKGYIGKLDPKTGDIMEYKLPDDVRDPPLDRVADGKLAVAVGEGPDLRPSTSAHSPASTAF